MIINVCRTSACPSDWEGQPDYSCPTLTAALAWLATVDQERRRRQETVTIRLSEGVFRENVSIETDHLILVGSGPGKTVLTGNLGAREILSDGIKRGTFRTQTLFLHGSQLTLRDMTIENTAGPGIKAGQALALYAESDGLYVENVHLLGYQDTLFTGPLPPTEREPGGFRGPLEYAPRVIGRQYYRNCLISGTVDFIFGGAQAWFENCTLHCRAGDRQCFITAASTPEGQAAGYLFNRCRITADTGAGSCWLGRPWREWAQVVFLHCSIEAPIETEGWHDWSEPTDPERTIFGEFDSTGAGAALTRAPFVHMLSADEADRIRSRY